MSKRTDDTFNDLTDKFMSDMEAVSCPLSEFVEALRCAARQLLERAALSQDEVDRQQE